MHSLFKEDNSGDESHDDLAIDWMEGDSLAPPCQTDMNIILDILRLANLNEGDFLFDLGCGDGRICIAATENYGVRSCGVEIEEMLASRFRENVEKLGLQEKVVVIHGDLQQVDLSEATVLVMYLLPEALALIQDKLIAQLNRGSRIVCNTWGLQGIQPMETIESGEHKNVKLFLFTKESLLLKSSMS
mmetsp:Transcript_38457/g.48549  ORF Transcript_38457/g.48549 Transcript_38457/m.48549 type:complete len:188 (+) Transcript_38457:103-666(+)